MAMSTATAIAAPATVPLFRRFASTVARFSGMYIPRARGHAVLQCSHPTVILHARPVKILFVISSIVFYPPGKYPMCDPRCRDSKLKVWYSVPQDCFCCKQHQITGPVPAGNRYQFAPDPCAPHPMPLQLIGICTLMREISPTVNQTEPQKGSYSFIDVELFLGVTRYIHEPSQ